MGSDQSKRRWEHGSMVVTLVDGTDMLIGDEIKGTISLTLQKPLNIYSVVVKVQGKEESQYIEYSDDKSYTYNSKRVHFDD